MPVPTPLGRAIAGAALLVSAAPSFAQDQPASAPVRQLRDLTTDRPDTTESPFTVDAGHVQVETTIFGYVSSFRTADGRRADELDVGVANIRIGLTPSVELDLGWQAYGVTSDGSTAADRSGAGAVVVRSKINLWGNDGGQSAFALLPYVVIPTDRTNGLSPEDPEFGVLLPLSLTLTDHIGLGLNTGLAVSRSEPGAPYRVSVPVTASLAVGWIDRIGSYYEVAAQFGGGDGAAISLNTGVTWLANPNLQFDTGIGFGVTRAADALAPFVGFSIRF